MQACFAAAQSSTHYFSPLSSSAYADKITEISNRKIPAAYADKKQQKTYADIVKERNDDIADDFKNDMIVKDTVLLNRCNNIIRKLQAANSAFPFDSISVYIYRTSAANASCHGEGTLYVNLGLFLWIDNDDELALVMGHELAHQFLHHFERQIKENIDLMSSEAFTSEMKAIKKSSDGSYYRYKNLMKDILVQKGTHSRYKESEADSLAVTFIRNAGYNVNNAANILLKLDHVDDLFVSDKVYTVRPYFENSGADSLVFKKNKRYNGLSTLTVTMNADKALDTIKTHPDCPLRFKRITGVTGDEQGCCTAISKSMQDVKQRALTEIVRYAYEIRRYTLCTHLCLFAIQNGFNDPYYYDFISMSFSGIYDADKKMERFSVTDAQANPGSTLKELQDFIFNASSTNVGIIAAYFLKSDAAYSSDDYYFAQLMYDKCLKTQDAAAAQRNFTASFPESKYNYLLKQKTQN